MVTFQKKEVESMARQSKNKKIGLVLLVYPILGLILISILWTVISYILSQSGDTDVIRRFLNILLGFIGVICMVGVIVGIPLGIIYLNKQDIGPDEPHDERSGKGEQSKIPEEITGWNWGAAGLTWIWGSCYRVWIAFFAFIPFLNIFWWIVLGTKGNEWAWKQSRWQSVEHFRASQNKWRPWGIAVFFIQIIVLILMALK